MTSLSIIEDLDSIREQNIIKLPSKDELKVGADEICQFYGHVDPYSMHRSSDRSKTMDKNVSDLGLQQIIDKAINAFNLSSSSQANAIVVLDITLSKQTIDGKLGGDVWRFIHSPPGKVTVIVGYTDAAKWNVSAAGSPLSLKTCVINEQPVFKRQTTVIQKGEIAKWMKTRPADSCYFMRVFSLGIPRDGEVKSSSRKSTTIDTQIRVVQPVTQTVPLLDQTVPDIDKNPDKNKRKQPDTKEKDPPSKKVKITP